MLFGLLILSIQINVDKLPKLVYIVLNLMWFEMGYIIFSVMEAFPMKVAFLNTTNRAEYSISESTSTIVTSYVFFYLIHANFLH